MYGGLWRTWWKRALLSVHSLTFEVASRINRCQFFEQAKGNLKAISVQKNVKLYRTALSKEKG